MKEITYEMCQYCPYCDTENGESGWSCKITEDVYEDEDFIPCKTEGEKQWK